MEAHNMKMGRPIKYTKKEIKELKEKLLTYIEENTIPIIAEFAYMNNIPRSTLYEFDILSDAMERCRNKKEANLEKGGLSGKFVPSIVSLSLKQLGWTDKQSIDINTQMKNIAECIDKLSNDDVKE